MYTFTSRVRFSETDENGKLSLAGIMNYLQDCSVFHSEDVGNGTDMLKSVIECGFKFLADHYKRASKML